MSKTIGQRIRELREQRGLTQAELAKLLGCAQNTVAEWEKRAGRGPSKKLLGQVAHLFDVTIEDLLGVETGKSSQTSKTRIPYFGKVSSKEFVWPDLIAPQDYLELPPSEYTPDRFCFRLLDDLLEPLIYKGDYCIFGKLLPQDGDIVVARFHAKALIRRWRQHNNEAMLCEVNPHQICTPYFLEIPEQMENEWVYPLAKQPKKFLIVEGKIVAVKRILKTTTSNPKISYIIS